MGLADVGPAQEIDAFALQRGDDHVLVAVRLLLPAVMRGLFFRVLRPLAPLFGPIDDELWRFRGRRLAPGKAARVPLRHDTPIIEGRPQDGQQPVDPRVHGRLTQTEEFRHDDLQGISPEIDEDKQQLLLGGMQCPPASSASGPSAGSAGRGPVRRIQSLIRANEGGQQEPKLRESEPGKCQELPTVTLEICIRYHAAIVDLISDKV
jgi:hypothetical protein